VFITDWWHVPLDMIWQQYVWAIPERIAGEHRHEPQVNASQVWSISLTLIVAFNLSLNS
jgi:hypothetical protein